MSKRIIIIGAGNLGGHLAVELKKQKYQILQVYSRTQASAASLSQRLDAEYTTVPNQVTQDADIYITALKDSVTEEILSQIDFNNRLLVHCSGSLPLSVLKKFSSNTGVLYPLQTFSRNRTPDFSQVPFFIEGSTPENENILLQLAEKISGNVEVLDSEKRIYLHIAAVFTCNFVNYLYSVGSEILEAQGLPFEKLKPLISETALKVMQMEPRDAQTGPAVRFDKNIINAHLGALELVPEIRKLYNDLSNNIFNYYKNNI